MKIKKLTGALLALAMIAGIQGCAAKEDSKPAASEDTTAEETTTEETSEETTEATTEETTEATTEETTAETTEETAEETTEATTTQDYGDLITVDDCGYGTAIQLPVINIESDEITKLNKQIRDDMDKFIGEDEVEDDYTVRFKFYSGKEGLHSIVIDYSYCGWDGFYKGYTFTDEGHVLSNEEVIGLFGVSKDEFYDKALEATENYMNDNFTYEDIPIVVDGEINLENAYIVSEDNEMYGLLKDSLSETKLNIDMPMVINDKGELCICQSIFPIADPHDCDVFYSVPDGVRLEVRSFGED